MDVNRSRLNTYLESVNENIQTMKMSSEIWFRSPPGNRINENDRFVRSLVGDGLSQPMPNTVLENDYSRLRSVYWSQVVPAKKVAVDFGAADHQHVNDYLIVDRGRSAEAVLSRVRRAAPRHSPADYFLRSVCHVSSLTGESNADSCRTVMARLARAWPNLLKESRSRAGGDIIASAVLHQFHEMVARPGDREPELGPGPSNDPSGAPAVLLTAGAAVDLSKSYMLSRLCFSEQEIRLAEELVGQSRVQSALLATHLQLVAECSSSLGNLVSQYKTPRVLLPFTEAAVDRCGYQNSSRISLAPNPKLLTVMCNNIIPAIAGELIRDGLSVDDLNTDVIRRGVASARRRHVFDVMIALFHQSDELPPEVVEMVGFSRRICPAASPFSSFLKKWLPFYFDRWPEFTRGAS